MLAYMRFQCLTGHLCKGKALQADLLIRFKIGQDALRRIFGGNVDRVEQIAILVCQTG